MNISNHLIRKPKAISSNWQSFLAYAVLSTLAQNAIANVDLADSPLFLTSNVEPNIMFILDDSGSMHWEIMPDELLESYFVYPRQNNLYSSENYSNWVPTFNTGFVYSAVLRSPQKNSVYYNPSITYAPWKNEDGSSMPNAVPTEAYHNPKRTNLGSRNLTTENTEFAGWDSCTGQPIPGNYAANCSYAGESRTFYPAIYYRFIGDETWDYASYQRVEIRSTQVTYTGDGRENRTDCADRANATCSYQEEIQNFANWYTYYRSRILAARGGIGTAFAQQDTNMRVGFGTLNAGSSEIDGVTTNKILSGVRRFEGNNRTTFFDLLYDRDIPTSGTPLRQTLKAAGEYFSRSDNRGPWGNSPGNNDTTAHLTCRSSYTILMTDGYWNGGTPDVGNVDNAAGQLITSPNGENFTYSPKDPYRDDHSDTLADVAMYYWKKDLRDNLNNNVPVSSSNDAFWQHMVTFGVGLGVTGTIDPDVAWSAVNTESPIAWPNPANSNPAKIDDLLHTGINSRGGFFSASDPITFANELSSVLQTIVDRSENSATSVAASAGVLRQGTLLFDAGFRSTDWSGYLEAFTLDASGNTQTIWNAESKLLALGEANRKIFTKNSQTSTFVSLSYNNLSTQQQTALNHNPNSVLDNLGAQRVQWLRGATNTSASLRSRVTADGTRLIGDIINSNPVFMGKRDYGFSLLSGTEGSSYLSYRNSNIYKNRPDVIFVASNSGHFHAFNATNDTTNGGRELFAYLPSELLSPLAGKNNARINQVMDPSYDHKYMMDGTASVSDVYINNTWKTVVVGTMGLGGRTIFALDVSDPANLTSSSVLWEFTDPDLGYGVTEPVITRLSSGEWAAIFGNGYNSDNHKAVLFVVDISDGSLIEKIITTEGSATQPNGLSPVAVTDWPLLNLSANYIYAGDLLGNLWRFDISSSKTSDWVKPNAYGKLFIAEISSNNRQPITVKPTLALNPDNPNQNVVLFGTGSYMRNQDAVVTNAQTQTLYGIFDESGNISTASRSSLEQQTIKWQSNVTVVVTGADDVDYTVREISNNPLTKNKKGWYLDLIYNGNNSGERVIANATLSSGRAADRVRFNTLIPDNDPCGTGRDGFLMDLNIANGGQYIQSVFDLNRDGVIDSKDVIMDGTAPRVVSGVKFGRGERATILTDPNTGNDLFIQGGTSRDNDNDNDDDESEPLQGLGSEAVPGRQNWQQLR